MAASPKKYRKVIQWFILFAITSVSGDQVANEKSGEGGYRRTLLGSSQLSVAEMMMRERKQWTSSHKKPFDAETSRNDPLPQSSEILNLTAVQRTRAAYYDPLAAPTYDTFSNREIYLQPTGMNYIARKFVAESIERERMERLLPTPYEQLSPLVVLVSGSGAEQVWPTLLLLGSARLLEPGALDCSSTQSHSNRKFELVVILPHDDTSSVVPCVGSQGCSPHGVGLLASGLRIIRSRNTMVTRSEGVGSTSNIRNAKNEKLLVVEALALFNESVHSSLVVVSASAVVAPKALQRLLDAVGGSNAGSPEPNGRPHLQVDVASPIFHGSKGSSGHKNGLENFYKLSDLSGLAFAGHPLNPVRVQTALEALPPAQESAEESRTVFRHGDFAEHTDSDLPLSAVALSSKAVKALRMHAHVGNECVLRLHFKVSEAQGSLGELKEGIVPRAFVYWNRGYDNVVAPLQKPWNRGNDGPERRSPLLLAITAAGIPDKTIGAIVTLEAGLNRRVCGGRMSKETAHPFMCARFDLIVGVSPFPGDRTGDFLEAAGISVLRQPEALGLSDLWNRVVRFAFFHEQRLPYKYLVISNNDVLIPPGAVGATNALLSLNPNGIATAVSQQGGAATCLGSPRGMPLEGAKVDTLAFAEHSFNYQLVQSRLTQSTNVCHPEKGIAAPVTFGVPFHPGKQFIAFFWGVSRDLASKLMLPDGSGRLFNTTAALNFGQETELMERFASLAVSSHKLMIGTAAYVHHFRGQTLGGCQNGHKDCAKWQVGHHADQTYHISGYSPKDDQPRILPWWEPDFKNKSPRAWKPSASNKKAGEEWTSISKRTIFPTASAKTKAA